LAVRASYAHGNAEPLDNCARRSQGRQPIEHLAAFATTYRYPSRAGRIKAPPAAADLTKHLADVEAALTEAVKRFGVDLS
jgi:hypothetical protein